MEDPEYLYYSTFHWQYLVNGYSGFFPPSYQKIVNAVRGFPDETSMNVIRSHGVRYLVIHGEWLYGARYDELIAELDRRPGREAGLAPPLAARGQARRDQRLPRRVSADAISR